MVLKLKFYDHSTWDGCFTLSLIISGLDIEITQFFKFCPFILYDCWGKWEGLVCKRVDRPKSDIYFVWRVCVFHILNAICCLYVGVCHTKEADLCNKPEIIGTRDRVVRIP